MSRISLDDTSGFGKFSNIGPSSDCKLFTDISKRKEAKLVKYLSTHYKDNHIGLSCPKQIPSDEREYIF